MTKEEIAMLTYGVLCHAAQNKERVFYTDLANIQDTFTGSGVQNRALCEIVEWCKSDDAGILSSLVVSNKTNMPGDGFFTAAHENGYRYRDRVEFVNRQQLQCFKDWEKEINLGVVAANKLQIN